MTLAQQIISFVTEASVSNRKYTINTNLFANKEFIFFSGHFCERNAFKDKGETRQKTNLISFVNLFLHINNLRMYE